MLYVEGYPRPEFRFLKTLAGAARRNQHGNKTIDLKVLLLDARRRLARPGQEPPGRDFPTKDELNQFDLVILGDVDPKHPQARRKEPAAAGRFRPRAAAAACWSSPATATTRTRYKDTPLADVLPIQVVRRPRPTPTCATPKATGPC